MRLLGFDHVHVTEREVAHESPCGFDEDRFEDCLWTTLVEWLRATGHPEIPATHAEAEALRCDAGKTPAGGGTLADARRGVKARYGLSLPGALRGQDLWNALAPGRVALAGGTLAVFLPGSHWRRWDPLSTGLHVAGAWRIDASDRVWWCDPLAPLTFRDPHGQRQPYVGEPMTKTDFLRFIGTSNTGIVGTVVAEEESMLGFDIVEGVAGSVTIQGPGHAAVRLRDGARIPLPAGHVKETVARIRLQQPLDAAPGNRRDGYLVGVDAAFILASDATFVPSE